MIRDGDASADRRAAALPARTPHGDVPPRARSRRPVDRVRRIDPGRARTARLSDLAPRPRRSAETAPSGSTGLRAGCRAQRGTIGHGREAPQPASPSQWAARRCGGHRPPTGTEAGATRFRVRQRLHDDRPRRIRIATRTTATPISTIHSHCPPPGRGFRRRRRRRGRRCGRPAATPLARQSFSGLPDRRQRIADRIAGRPSGRSARRSSRRRRR